MKEKNLKLLRKLGKEMKDKKPLPTTDEYYRKEQKAIEKIRKENAEINASIRMTDETYRRKFTI
jgi:hypothetical protein